jgi:hypothetical protein
MCHEKNLDLVKYIEINNYKYNLFSINMKNKAQSLHMKKTSV